MQIKNNNIEKQLNNVHFFKPYISQTISGPLLQISICYCKLYLDKGRYSI